MNSRSFRVERTARVIESAEPSTQSQVWICLHGYGELGEAFIRKVSVLASEHSLVVVPEGLSRFYTKGGAGPVGASWMTKEDRLSEIHDYCNYLNSVLKFYKASIPQLSSVNILGFSQGAATACRWYGQLREKIDNLVLWGAVFPPDMEIPDLKSTDIKIWLYAGTQDPYLKEEEINKMKDKVHELIRYEGGHDIQTDQLGSIVGSGL